MKTCAEIHVGSNAFDALRDDWSAMRVPSIFLTREWAESWDLTYGHAGQAWIVALRDANHSLTGLAPLFLSASHVGPLPAGRLLTWFGAGEVCPDHMDLAVADTADPTAVRNTLLDAIWKDRQHWDALRLTDVPAESQTLPLLADWCNTHRLHLETRVQDECPILALPSSWDLLEPHLSANFRHQLRRHGRVMTRDEDMQTQFCVDPTRLESAMDTLEALHRERRQALDGGLGVFARPAFRDFHHDLARRLLARGWLRLAVLVGRSGALAAYYGFSYAGVLSLYQSGLSNLVPNRMCGQLLVASLIQDAIARGDHRCDFLRGWNPYKKRWTDRCRRTVDVFIARRTMRGTWAAWSRRLRRWMRQSRPRVSDEQAP